MDEREKQEQKSGEQGHYNTPYSENGGHYRGNFQNAGDNLGDFINGAVRFGTNVGSTVLGSIADALASVGDMGGKNKGDEPMDFARWRRKLDRKMRNSDRYSGGMAMAICGWLFAGMFGIAALVMGILNGVGAAALGMGSEFAVFDILFKCFTPITIGFGVMGWFGSKRVAYFGRLFKYLRSARDWVCDVPSLAKNAMMPQKKVSEDLQKAIVNGDFPDACMDDAQRTFYLDDSLYRQAAAPQPQPEPTAETQETPQQKFKREGVDFLGYLRACRGKLNAAADEELALMQKTCGGIMGFVNNHPEQINRVRRFQEYYLPTTRKLLDTAMGLGSAEVSNAQNIRQDITGILHTLNLAYTKLYDTLLQDVSMDVSTEIDTLETMLRQDGLTHDFDADFGQEPRA